MAWSACAARDDEVSTPEDAVPTVELAEQALNSAIDPTPAITHQKRRTPDMAIQPFIYSNQIPTISRICDDFAEPFIKV